MNELQKRYAVGLCPCCGCWGAADPVEREWQPQTIAEGVRICGECAYRGHCDDSDAGRETVAEILRELVAPRN